jgi:5'-nucleotidase
VNKPLILVSNDDGITSKGIATLVQIMSTIGEVVVVAPDSHQSGMGHAITISEPLRLRKQTIFGSDIQAYTCSGTPADCVKFGKHYLLKDRKPDLVVSGINHGSNASISVIYSGTMSAAIEAAIEGLPAIGFSLCDEHHDAVFSHVAPFITQITQQVLTKGLPTGVALNVNIPKITQQIQGIRIARQARAVYREFFEPRRDPYGRQYFWMDGELDNSDHSDETDLFALANGYVSVVPCQFDMTAYRAMEHLKTMF